jgi:integrase/recombinase XerD
VKKKKEPDKQVCVPLQDYLSQRHTPGTTARYQRDIKSYLASTADGKALQATYSDIMDYLGVLRQKYRNPATIKCHLQAIKKYYHWLNHTGQRSTHPCRDLKLRGASSRDIQVQDLFSPAELEMLMDRQERYSNLKERNQVIISLLIYQGLTRNDIVGLTLNDINLEEGTIYIKADTRTNRRTLKLKPRQIMLFYKYLQESRPRLLKVSPPGEDLEGALIITKSGTPEKGEGIGYLLETARDLFPGRKLNAKTIRQSVIANQLKTGHDLRVVQTFAGHKYPGATERYRQSGIEALKAGVEKYHPLK